MVTAAIKVLFLFQVFLPSIQAQSNWSTIEYYSDLYSDDFRSLSVSEAINIRVTCLNYNESSQASIFFPDTLAGCVDGPFFYSLPANSVFDISVYLADPAFTVDVHIERELPDPPQDVHVVIDDTDPFDGARPIDLVLTGGVLFSGLSVVGLLSLLLVRNRL